MFHTLYDLAKDLKFSADAFSFGLGTVLLQNDNSKWRPVTYVCLMSQDRDRMLLCSDRERGTCH